MLGQIKGGEQFKNFSTRKMKAELHYRLKLMAALKNYTMEDAFNEALGIGLDEMEKMTGQTVVMPGRGGS